MRTGRITYKTLLGVALLVGTATALLFGFAPEKVISAPKDRLQVYHHPVSPGGPPYTSSSKNPIHWGGMSTGQFTAQNVTIARDQLEKHNVVIRITKAGLEEIKGLIKDILSADSSVANLVNFLAMNFLDRCTDTPVVADTWDRWFDFTEWLRSKYTPGSATYNYYLIAASYACGVSTTTFGEGTTHCFDNLTYFEYIGGYNPTGTWDEGANICKDDGKGLLSTCLPIPLINDEGAPLCVNAVIWGQERDKRVNTAASPITYAIYGFNYNVLPKCALVNSNVCPTSLGWDTDYFLDKVTRNRLILDYNRDRVDVILDPNIGTDYPATASCEGDRTAHTEDDRLDVGIILRNFEISMTFTSPFVDYLKSNQNRFLDCNSYGGASFTQCNFDTSATANSFPNELSYCLKNRQSQGNGHICDPDHEKYDETRVISNYINGRALVRLPILSLVAGIAIKGNFEDSFNWDNVVRGIGVDLKAIDVQAGVQYDFVPMVTSATTPACWNPALNTVGSVTYCPEYRVSQKFAKTLLWLDAVIRFIAIDNFNLTCSGNPSSQYDTCIAYYLFPTQIFSLRDLLNELKIDHPLEEVVYIGPTTYYEHKPNKIFIDAGFTNDFWADRAGILIPMNVGVDIRYVLYNSSATRLSDVKRNPSFSEYVTSCVQFASGIQPATSPINPIVKCQPQGYCPASDQYEIGSGSICTTESGVRPYVFASDLLPVAPSPSTLAEGRYGYSITNYYVGLGIHHNFVSRVLYEVVGDGIACIWVDKYTPLLGGLAGSFLNTDSFGLFMPKLKQKYPGKDMAVEIVPMYKDPGSAGGNTGGAATYNMPLSVVVYSKTGGPTFKPVNSVYSSSSTRYNFWQEYMANATSSTFVMFPTATTWFDTADLMIDIPYVDLSFNVVTTGNITDNPSAQAWQRVFGLTLGIRLSVDLDIVPCASADCSLSVEWPGYDDTNFNKPLTSYYRTWTGYVDTSNPNYFPSGGIFARVVDLTLYVDPDVRYFIAYSANALGLSGSDWKEILGSILPVILNGVAGAKLRLALDLGSLLQIPMYLNFPWIGPEFAGANYNTSWGDVLNNPVTAYDTSFAGSGTDKIGDYFELFVHWQGRPKLRNIMSLLSAFGVDLMDTLGSLGLAPPVPAVYTENGANGAIRTPETFITYTSSPHALYTRIDFAGWSPRGGKLRYSWRLDGGTWNLWSENTSVVLHHLLEGTHVFEVRAKDEEKFIDITPARYIFRIDSVGPDIYLSAKDVYSTSKVVMGLDVEDYQAPRELLSVQWKIDDGDWSGWVPANEVKKLEFSLSKGEHILKVRAKDDVGNISEYTKRFFVSGSNKVFSCSSAGGLSILWILSFVPFAIRKIKNSKAKGK